MLESNLAFCPEFVEFDSGNPFPCKVNGNEVMAVKFRYLSANRVELILEDGSSTFTVPSHIIINSRGVINE